MKLSQIVEAILLAAQKPLSVDQLLNLLELEFPDLTREEIREAIADTEQAYAGRALGIQEVAGGYRFQIRQSYAEWVGKLSEERPQKYSRALLETLAIIAYRQPITRADIEDIRGVAVSTQIVKTLQERDWIRVVGHKEVPGRPALLATTRQFLDYFNLSSLDQLPPLADIRDFDEVSRSLDLKLEDVISGNETSDGEASHDEESADTPATSLLH